MTQKPDFNNGGDPYEGMTDEEICAWEEQNEYRLSQNAHNAKSSVPFARDGKISRFFKGADCPDDTTYDVVYIDRTTGQCVMRYDGADPANTNPYYGASPDSHYLAKKGYDITEMIDPSQAKFSDDEIRRTHCRESYSSYDDYYDEGPYDDDEMESPDPRDSAYDRNGWSS